jgi:hypothetical protein
MFVIDVFKGSLLLELGVMEQALEPEIFSVGFLILDHQAEELLMAEIGCVRMRDFISEAFGHTEEPKRVQSG